MKRVDKNPLTLKIDTTKQIRMSSEYTFRQKTPVSPVFRPNPNQVNHSLRYLSPFQQITSKTSIYTHLLPSFCRIPRSPTNPPINLSTPPMNLKLKPSVHLKSKIYKEISQFFYEDSRIFDSFSLKSHGFEAGYQDLATLKPQQTTSDTILKMSFKSLQKKNILKNVLNKNQVLSVFIVDVAVCQKVFREGFEEFEGFGKDLKKFRQIVFPIYIGYWVLGVCDFDRKVIKLYDPVGIESQDKMIRKRILKYLSDGVTGNAKLRKFRYENFTESEVYDHVDSGVYILMQTYKNCVKPNFVVSPEGIEKFRVKLLYNILEEYYKDKISES